MGRLSTTECTYLPTYLSRRLVAPLSPTSIMFSSVKTEGG